MTDEQKVKRNQQAARRRELAKAEKDAWKDQVDAHFAYLRTDYQFRITKTENFWYVTSVIYQSPTTIIQIDRSVEFNRVEVLVARVVNDEVAKNPVSNTLHITMKQCFLDEIIALRAPQLQESVADLKGLANDKIEQALIFWAPHLKEYAADVLQGLFASFAEIEAKRKQSAI